MEELKAIVRKIRNGENVEGYIIEDDILKGPGQHYQIFGSERLRLVEVPMKTKTPANTTKPKKEPKKPHDVQKKEPKIYLQERECVCGRIFPLTKFNQNIFECPECRKAKKKSRSTGSVDRKFICPECGEEFIISKFQPYYNPERCQKCNRKHQK